MSAELAADAARAIEAELPTLRAFAEARMTATVEIGTYGPWRYDDDLGMEVRSLLDSFATKARVRSRSAQQVRETELGERSVVTVDRELHIPWDAPATHEGQVARVVALGPLDDPTLLGQDLMLVGPIPGSQQTARRLLVREVQT